MRAGRIGRMVAVGLAMLALMTMHVAPAGAYELVFSQTTGFNSTTGTLQGLGQGNPAVIGQGGAPPLPKAYFAAVSVAHPSW